MIRGIWVHQWNQLSERTPQEIADTLRPRGIEFVYIKSHDGIYWMSQVYSHPMAPSAANFAQLVREFDDVGLSLVPWVVPRGYNSMEEARMHSIAAKMADSSVIVDFEYKYAGFFDQGGVDEFKQYTQALLNGVPGGWVACAPDPRQPVRDYPLDILRPYHAQLPQTYWAMFQRPWQEVLSEADDRLRPITSNIEPILDADAPAHEIAEAQAWCEQQGYEAISLWRMGQANAEQLDAFGTGVPLPVPDPQPQPEPEPGHTEAEYINALGYLAGDAIQPLRKYKSKIIKNVVKEIERVADQYGARG
jgi:hypothetical protein